MTKKNSVDHLVAQWQQERPDISMDHLGIQLRIRGLAMLMDRRMEHICSAFDIKLHELYILYALRRSGAPYRLRPTDIYKVLQVTSGTITHKLDSLEKAGFISRSAAPQDRRSTYIELLPKGLALVDRAVDFSLVEIKQDMDAVFSNARDTAKFVATLSKLGAMYDRLLVNEENPLVHHQASTPHRKPPTA